MASTHTNQNFSIATVIENRDPQHLGRVKVEYNIFEGKSAELRSEWVQVVAPYASHQSGSWFLPEIKDKVLVFAASNSYNHPVVFGSVYSDLTKPPASGRSGDYNDDNNNNLKFIRTRAGHLLCFDDTEGKETIVLKDKENRRLEIQSAENTIDLRDGEQNGLTIKGNEIRVNNKDGSQVVIRGADIEIKNSGGDTVKPSGGNVTIKSQSVKIEAASSVELGSGAAEALVKGNSFMGFFNSHTHNAPGCSGGPTSPPLAPMTPGMLSTKVKTS